MQASVTVDYYKILGVSRDASTKDINTAYKKLALKHHPDKAGDEGNSLTRFRKIQEAVEVLRDPARRKKHDNELHYNKHSSRILKDDPDFGGPGYTGWTPYGGRSYDLNNWYDRYMFSYGNADHMNPNAVPRDAWAEAAEKLAQWDREEAKRKQTEKEAVKTEAELQMEKEKRRKEAMRARVLRDEEEMEEEENEEELSVDEEGEDGQGAAVENVEEENVVIPEAESEEQEESESDDDDDDDDEDKEEEEEHSTGNKEADKRATVEDAETSAPEQSSTGSNKNEDESDEEGYDMARLTPYFNSKLAHPSGRYTQEDLQIELKGIVLETFCGFLEELRLSFSGAQPMTPGNDPESCPHHGMWTKEFLKEECEVCHRFKPLYALTCPGCGKKACIGCKFDHDDV